MAAEKAKRLFQSWELDIDEAKQRFRRKVHREVQAFERRLLKPKENEEEQGEESSSSREVRATREKALPRVVIGKLRVRVKALEHCSSASKAYFVIRVEDEVFKSPVAFRDAARDAFLWELEGTFPVTDICSTVSVAVFTTSTLKANDRLLGRVSLPVSRWRGDAVSRDFTGAYKLFPVRPRTHRDVPGHIAVLGSARSRKRFDDELLLTMRAKLELAVPERVPRWALYVVNQRAALGAPPQSSASHEDDSSGVSASSATTTSPQAILGSIADLKRNSARVSSALQLMRDAPPLQLLRFVRSWGSPALSMAALGATLVAARYVSFAAAPWLLLLSLALELLRVRLQEPPVEAANVATPRRHWVVWDDEVTEDPEQGLSSVQMFARVVDKIESIASGLGTVADVLERLLNLCGCADPDASLCAFLALALALAALQLSQWVAFMLELSWAGLLLLGYIVWPLLDRGSSAGAADTESVHARVKEGLRGLWERIPTDDDRGAAWIAHQQMLRHDGNGADAVADADADDAAADAGDSDVAVDHEYR